MSNKIISLFHYFIIVLLFSSCNHFNGYKIKGSIKNGNGVKVYLEDIADIAPLIIDTATITDNTFELKNYSSNGIYRLRFGDDFAKSIYLYIKENDKIAVTADLNTLENYKVEGSEGSSSIQQLNMDVKKYADELDSTASKINRASAKEKDSLVIVFKQKKTEYIKFVKAFIEKEKINDIACFAIGFLGDFKRDEVPYIVEEVERLHTASPDSKLINLWYAEIQKYRESVEQQNQGGVALNTQAPNIILQNPNGDTIQLKNLKGNYVLVDFWASWCGPCRMENPNVVKLYNKYHAQGFDIFSVSLDTNKEQWKKAIAKDKLIWKNHGCDFGYWNSAPAQQYQVQSIPATFLLDKNGKVIAKNLRGEQLETKLAELFPEKTN